MLQYDVGQALVTFRDWIFFPRVSIVRVKVTLRLTVYSNALWFVANSGPNKVNLVVWKRRGTSSFLYWVPSDLSVRVEMALARPVHYWNEKERKSPHTDMCKPQKQRTS